MSPKEDGDDSKPWGLLLLSFLDKISMVNALIVCLVAIMKAAVGNMIVAGERTMKQ